MYIDQNGTMVPPVHQQYEGCDGTTYPAGFPREDIHGLTWVEDPPPTPPEAPSFEAIKDDIIQRTHERLNTFAQSRGYDSILSACTYATSTFPVFQAEGQCCVDARDATWSFLYTLLEEIQAGTKQPPSSFSEVEPLLPVLSWPS